MNDASEPGLIIPRRQPAFADAVKRRGNLGRMLGGRGSKLSESLWQALGEGYLQGDPPVDEVVAWMTTEGARSTHSLLDRVLRQGIDSVPDAPVPLRKLFVQLEQRPEWFDEDLLAEGARMCQLAGNTGFYVLRDGGLMPGYLSTPINQTLILTGALQRGARRRLAETMKWWLDCTEAGGMERGAPGYRGTLHVRFMHAFVRRRVQGLPQWRADDWGVPVNQSDMAGTYLVFAIAFLLGLRVMGVPISRREGRAVVHFWRYVSWLMGVDERWLVNTEAEGRSLLWHIALSQPAPDASCAELGRALMNEPLQRHYPNFGWLRGRFERERHLSVTRLFVDQKQMRSLGLPARIVPWYPLVSLPVTFLWRVLHRALPGGKERLIRTGREAQVDLVRRHFGGEAPAVGALKTA